MMEATVTLKEGETLLSIEPFPLINGDEKIAIIKGKDYIRTEPVPNLMDLWQLPSDIKTNDMYDNLGNTFSKLGIEFKEIPTDDINTNVTMEIMLPEDMDWKLAKELLPPDLYLSLKNRPKPTIQYYKP